MELTEKEKLQQVIKEEYKRCVKDPAYFIRKYCQIKHPKKGLIKFEMWDFQAKTLREILDNHYNIILKSRQLGISTLVAAYALWMMLFHDNKAVLVIATKKDVAKNLVSKVSTMYSHLPSWLRMPLTEDNKLSLAFGNGSNIKAEASSKEAGRSEALSLLILDEAAFIEHIDTIWGSAVPTLSTGGDCIILSTPNGVGNLFHKVWQSAEDGMGFGDDEHSFNFHPILLPWTVHPEHDKKWRAQQDKLLGERLAAQECDASFISSGAMVISGDILEWYKKEHVVEPIEKKYIDHNYWVWEYADYTKTYVVASDVARGDGSDFSTFVVLDVERNVIVAEYKGQIGTTEFGNLLVSVATEYNDALLVIENQNMGWAVVQQVINRNYHNLFYSSSDMMYVDVQSQLKRGFDMRTVDNTTKLIAGITCTPNIRHLVVSKIDEYFRDKLVITKSSRLINEFFTFIWKSGRAEHMSGYNDDIVFAVGYALLIRDTAMKLKLQSIDIYKRSLNSIQRTTTPIISSMQVNRWHPPVDPYKMQVGGGSQEDIRWLFDGNQQRKKEHEGLAVESEVTDAEVIQDPPMPTSVG